MKKEAINSFNDGLVMDLNELNTPDKVLTDCLNGTLITYNGNEMTLQNDMGNAKIDTSFLRDGYVPVGMKEYGGIIYVASYNPITKKGQIGSFPSPQQLFYDDSDKTISDFRFMEDMLELKDGKIWIYQEFVRKEISNEIFSSGDKFILTFTENIDDNLKFLIDNNILVLRLAVLSDEGQLNYISDKGLRYDDNTNSFIFNPINIDFSEILSLKNNDYYKYLQTYGSNSSGKLYLCGEYRTANTWSLSHTIVNDSIGLGVKTIIYVEPFEDVKGLEYGIYDGNHIPEKNIEVKGKTITFTHYFNNEDNEISNTVYLDTNVGVLKRLNYSYAYTREFLTTIQDSLDTFDYDIKNGEIIISYSYTYINNIPDKSSMEFTLYDIADFNRIENNEIIFNDSANSIKITDNRDSYFGTFYFTRTTESLNIDPNKIYICVIQRVANGPKYYRMVYGSGILNYESPTTTIEATLSTNINLVNPQIDISDTLNGESKTTIVSTDLISDTPTNFELSRKYKLTYPKPDNSTIISIPENVRINNNTIPLSSIGLGLEYDYEGNIPVLHTDVVNNSSTIYTNQFVKDTPKEAKVEEFYNTIQIELEARAYSTSKEITYSSNNYTTLKPMLESINDSHLIYSGTAYTGRNNGGDVTTMGTSYRRVLTGNNKGYSGGSEKEIYTIGREIKSGRDEANYNFSSAMNNLNINGSPYATIGVLVGWPTTAKNPYDDGSFKIEGTKRGNYNRDGFDDTDRKVEEVSSGANWLILAMKGTSGSWLLLNLGSACDNTSGYSDKSPGYTNALYLAQIIFSQILVPVKGNKIVKSNVPDMSTWEATDYDTKIYAYYSNLNESAVKLKYGDINLLDKMSEIQSAINSATSIKDRVNFIFPELKVSFNSNKQEIVINNILNSDPSVKNVFNNAANTVLTIKDLDIDKSTFYLAELEDTPFSINSTIANIKKNKDGDYEYNKDANAKLIFPDFVKNGYAGGNNPTHVESGVSIRYLRKFLTLLHKNELGTNNTLLINEDYQYITKKRTTWVKDASQHAGDFCVGAYFATELKFRDER